MNVHDGIYYLIKNSESLYGLTELPEDDKKKEAFRVARDILERIEKRQLYKYIGDLLWEKKYMATRR